MLQDRDPFFSFRGECTGEYGWLGKNEVGLGLWVSRTECEGCYKGSPGGHGRPLCRVLREHFLMAYARRVYFFKASASERERERVELNMWKF